MRIPGSLGTTLIAVFAAISMHAGDQLLPLRGTCHIAASAEYGKMKLKLEVDSCGTRNHCGTNETDEPVTAISGLSISDFAHNGQHSTATMNAEAGTLTCAGAIHESELSGDFTFSPDSGFVSRMQQMGFGGLDSEKLMAYTLFRVEISWIKSLQAEGVSGITTDKIIALRIFNVDADYIHSLSGLGYSVLDAEKLIALKVQGVNAAEIKEIQNLGYQPTADELVQIRIFHITPEFIKRMQARNLKDLSISKLVQIRIFKLAD